MARKKKPEEHENHERWLISYADFITLLFAFFVVMYSLSSINEGKFRVLASSLSASFRGPPRSMSPIQVGKTIEPSIMDGLSGTPKVESMSIYQLSQRIAIDPIKLPIKSMGKRITVEKTSVEETGSGEGTTSVAGESYDAVMTAISESIHNSMEFLIRQDLVKIRRFRFWLEIEINSNILFQSGSARLEDNAIPILNDIAEIVKGYPNPINVEGFTDDVPIATYLYPSNWELSTARATSVVHLLIKQGVEAGRLAAVGHGEYKPTESNATAEGRRENRKVVLVIFSTSRADV